MPTLFWELCRLSFRRQLTYRAATLAGLATNLFFGLLRAAVLTAFYGARREEAALSLDAAITFTGLTQALIMVLSLFGWDALAVAVHTGDIAGDLLKPLHYFTFWLAQDLGRALAALLLRGLPIMAVYALLFHIVVPQDAAQWLALALALSLGWLISFAWRFLANLSAFWTPNALGILRFAYGAALLLSGFIVPLRFFPDWLAQLCYLTPFPAMVTTTAEVYLGVLQGPALVWALLAQVFWVAALGLAAQLGLRAGVRHLVIQGG